MSVLTQSARRELVSRITSDGGRDLPNAIRPDSGMVVNAWQSPAYRNGLSAEQRAALPANPAGELQFVGAKRAPKYANEYTQDQSCSTYNSSCSTYSSSCSTYNSGCTTYNSGCPSVSCMQARFG